jgi:protein KRI1
MIQDVAGGGAGALSEVDLSGDFDPEAWDKRMAELFDDTYYAQDDEGFRAAEDEYDEGEYAKRELADAGVDTSAYDGEWGGEEDGEGWGEEWWGDEGGEGSSEGTRSRKGGAGGGGGGFEQLTAKLRKSGDAAKKTAQQYMDEYYALDYEDLIGGDLPTRFKYHAVPASGYGITDAEMLEEDERKLSKRVPLRYVKRPYAKLDDARLKSRANRLRWEQRREERVDAAVAEAKKARKGGKGDRGGGDHAGGGIKRKREASGTDRASADGGAGGEGESEPGGQAAAKRARAEKRAAREAKAQRSAASSAPQAEPEDLQAAKKAAKKAKLKQKHGVTDQRLEAFAKLAEQGKAKKKKKKDA